ncbi:hypothetical protein I7I51_03822 [Histoplasma capsulatum]|uniref:Uncharacterized protein n=1 Tax=Ajellomyces capsulatus TaxID=5037 RepID=A0A8A1M7I1_AJECA|nr:hypothetical protein I7I51_03822 [Histoplasma capsulatum]
MSVQSLVEVNYQGHHGPIDQLIKYTILIGVFSDHDASKGRDNATASSFPSKKVGIVFTSEQPRAALMIEQIQVTAARKAIFAESIYQVDKCDLKKNEKKLV